jgi:ribosome-associated translation inhibitor RaiA
MKVPLQITFRSLPSSETLAERVRTRVDELDRLYGRLMHCHVTIELPHRHQHKGRLYRVRIELGVPGKELVVSSDAAEAHEHEDPYVAVRDAFDAARRQLEHFARRQRGMTKTHAAPV